MIRIYHNDKYAIVADEYHRTYKEVSKKDAITISKSVKSVISWYASLENRRNTLIQSGYTKIA